MFNDCDSWKAESQSQFNIGDFMQLNSPWTPVIPLTELKR